jgi:peptidoglycan/LPS O-acetylase OafA/YrhL
MWVVIFHIWVIAGLHIGKSVADLIDGANAVDVFIILSGFVICLLRIKAHEPWPIFAARRFLRLFPAYFVMVLGSIALAYAGVMPVRFTHETFAPLLAAHLAMLQGLIPETVIPHATAAFLNPTWSISLEWQFYLVAPLLISALMRGWKGFLVTTAIFVVLTRLSPVILPHMNGAFLLTKLSLFWVGIVSALSIGPARLLTAKQILTVATVAVGLELMILPIHDHIGLFVWSVVYPIILLGHAAAEPRWTASIRSVLESRRLLELGSISYSVYLCHEPIIWAVRSGLLHFIPGASPMALTVAFVPTVIPATILSAWALNRLVERPFISMGRRIGARVEA